ncbi:MAG: SsgA family sporulation/cell division regulator [Actinobacteria bacterium]|nr:SsgA family sporulation/cell division regulator [Actinomycetota bacterium]
MSGGGLIVVPHLVRAVDGWVGSAWVFNPADPLAVWLRLAPGDGAVRCWALAADLLAAGLVTAPQRPAGIGDVTLHTEPAGAGGRLVIDLTNGSGTTRFWADRRIAAGFCWQVDAAVTGCLGGAR